ncbi:MAG: hypothetical protein D9V44_06720 [Actinobacteria bacterium]|nr:MAG: hypothetical protein D9V44_06720 [Actinomycetota bacterium]
MYAIIAALAIGIVLLASAAGTRAARMKEPNPGDLVAPAANETSAPIDPLRDPTPIFATYRSLNLRLPVDPGDVTALAFHQASGRQTLAMDSLAPDADMAQAAKLKAVPASQAPSGSAESTASIQTVWQGSVLRLWRSNRTGAPDTAADVGADPGSIVYAPVTGTVLQVRAYKLYSKYPDYEIHIKPDGWPEVDVVLIHVDDVSVVAGDRVTGGASRIACVRKMSDKIDIQLGGYTRNGGDHVHVQLNRVAVPGKLEQLTGS